jgi:hypothetical protein
MAEVIASQANPSGFFVACRNHSDSTFPTAYGLRERDWFRSNGCGQFICVARLFKRYTWNRKLLARRRIPQFAFEPVEEDRPLWTELVGMALEQLEGSSRCLFYGHLTAFDLGE